MSQQYETTEAKGPLFGPDDVLAVFDGQGTQWEGMGHDVYRRYAAAREVFKLASDAVGINMERVCFGDNGFMLQDTRVAQPAIATVGLAKYRAYRETSPEPNIVTGLSKGLYVAVGVSSIKVNGERDTPDVDHQIITLVSKRSKIMHDVAHGKNGKMLPVIGLSQDELKDIIKGTRAKIGVYLDNTIHTLTGEAHDLESIRAKISSIKGRVSDYLPIQQAAHHELQEETVEPMSTLLEGVGITDPEIIIAANEPYYLKNATDIKVHLTEQMTESVRWSSVEAMLIADGIRKVVQFGADEKRSLARQMARNGKEFGVQSIVFPQAA